MVKYLLWFLILFTGSHAAGVKLEADKTRLGLRETLSVAVILEGIEGRPDPDSIQFEKFETLSSSSESSLQIINGSMNQTYTLKMLLKPESEGDFRLGPLRVQHGGETYVSNVLDVTVQKGVVQRESRVFAEAQVSDTSPYTGEQVFWNLKIYQPEGSSDFGSIQYGLPDFSEVIVEDDWASQTQTREAKDGTVYKVTKIQIPFFPVRSSNLQIDGAQVSWVERKGRSRSLMDQFFQDDFFGNLRGRRQQGFSNDVNLEVQALPQPLPENFSNLVGRYSISATVDQTQVEVGDTLNLRIELTGIGALQDWKPNLPEFKGFRAYPEETGDVDMKRNQQNYLGGVKTLKVALVPQSPGTFDLPDIRIPYFNPYLEKYEESIAELPQIHVEGEAIEQPNLPSGTKLARKNEDSESGSMRRKVEPNPWLAREYLRGIAWGLLCLPLLSLVGLKLKQWIDKRSAGRRRYALNWYRKQRKQNTQPAQLIPEFLYRVSDGCLNPRDMGEAYEKLQQDERLPGELIEPLATLCLRDARAAWAKEGQAPQATDWDNAVTSAVAIHRYF